MYNMDDESIVVICKNTCSHTNGLIFFAGNRYIMIVKSKDHSCFVFIDELYEKGAYFFMIRNYSYLNFHDYFCNIQEYRRLKLKKLNEKI